MKRLLIITILAMSLPACATRYEIRYPNTNEVHYAKDYDKMKSGSVRFTDAITGTKITITSSEIKKISKEEFEEVTKKAPEGKDGW